MEKPKSLTELQTKMNQIITVKKHQILAQKPVEKQYLNYTDFNDLCDAVKQSYCEYMQTTEVPKPIEAACHLALAVVSPSARIRIIHIKTAKSLLAGMAGIAAILSGVAIALGWTATVLETVVAFFVGGAVFGPIVLVVGGLGLIGIAAYFAYAAKNPTDLSDKAEATLRETLRKTIAELWEVRDFEQK